MSFVMPEFKSNLMVLGVKLDEPIVEPSPSPDYPWYTDDNGGPGDDILLEDDWLDHNGDVIGEYNRTELVLVYNTSLSSMSFMINGTQITEVSYVDWGDGNISKASQGVYAEVAHTYENDGEYVIHIRAKTLQNDSDLLFNNNKDGITSIVEYIAAEITSDASNLFQNWVNLVSVEEMYLPEICASTGGMFFNCPLLTTVPEFNTANVLDMGSMFSGCSSITTVPLFDTGKVTSMNNMFGDCRSLTSVPLFNTISVSNMSMMFMFCTSLPSVPEFNTANVMSMMQMFMESGLQVKPTFVIPAGCDTTDMYIGTLFEGEEI